MNNKRDLISPYHLWEPPTWVIPKMYWDAMSQEQRIHAICRQIEKLICYVDYLGGNVDELTIKYDELKADFDKFMESGFDDYYLEQIEAWVYANMPQIIGYAMRMVFFGCTADGHFTAYIPDSWDPIYFNYGVDYQDKNTYGHIILEMFVTDTFQVNGRPTNLIWEVVDNG